MTRHRRYARLILLLLGLLAMGCGLSQPAFPFISTPTAIYLTVTPNLTEAPETRALKATGESMKATAFTLARNGPEVSLFRENPDPMLFITALPGIPLVLLGAGLIWHYNRVRRRGWDVGVRYEGFKTIVGVGTGKQVIQGAKVNARFSWLLIALGIFLVISGILIAVIQ